MKKAMMSHEQKRMWFSHQMLMESTSVDSDVYNIVLGLEIKGDLEINYLLHSFENIVARHEILRTTLEMVDDQPMQIIHDVNGTVKRSDWYCEFGSDYTYQECVNELYKVKFDLSKLPLYKLGIIKAETNRYYFVFCIHHTLFDGWSSEVLFRELFEGYASLKQKGCIVYEPLNYQYVDYSLDKQKKIDAELDKYKEFWVNHLEDVNSENEFPLDFERVNNQNGLAGYVDFCINGDLQKSIKKFCAQNRITVYVFMLSCYSAVMSRYKQSDVVTVGVTLLGRDFDTRNTIGDFVNTMPVRLRCPESADFLDYLRGNKEVMKKVMENQDYPFNLLVNQMNVDRGRKKNPLFSVSFQYNAWSMDRNIIDSGNEVEGLMLNSIAYRNPTSLFDMDLELFQKSNCIDGYLQYDKTLIKEETAQRFVESYLKYIDQIILEAKYTMKDISCISESDRLIQERVINREIDYSMPDYTIIDLFEECVKNTPQHVASRCNGMEKTFEQLDICINQYANFYVSCGITKGKRVIIQMPYGSDMLASLLALIKIGATYIPVNSTYPIDRINHIIEEADVFARIVNSDNAEKVDCMTINVCEFENQIMEGGKTFENLSSLEDIIYIIYTSGSTGRPKGVQVTHRNLYNYLTWAKRTYCQRAQENFAVFGSCACDLVCTSLFVPLISGGTVNLFNDNQNKYILSRVIEDENITILKVTPSHLIILNDLDISKSKIHTIIAGGENLLTTTAYNTMKKFSGKIRIFNEYGPTEATVACMLHQYDVDTDKKGSVPIGKAADNNNVWVLGKDLELVPSGVIGELYISGVQVTEGYLNNEKMTTERFIEHKELGRLYKTGDVVVIRDGLIHYLGRNDDQVKINGNRIELNEINETISELYNDIKHVCTAVKEGNVLEKILVVYYDGDFNESNTEIKARLGKRMPQYMVPSIFVKLDNFPILENGKINQKEIVNIPLVIESGECEDEGELTETETTLKHIWEAGLKNGVTVSKKTNFFEVGGHSILAIHVINQIKDKMQLEIALQKIFDNPVLEDLAKCIDEIVADENIEKWRSIQHYEDQNKYELAPVQKPEWYLYELEPDSSFYNSSSSFIIKGHLDVEAMKKAVSFLFRTNRLFRTGFKVENGIPYQFVREYNENVHKLIFEEIERDVDDSNEKDTVIKAVADVSDYIFDLLHDNLFRLHLFKIKENKFLFTLVTHHIIWDEVSNINLVGQLAKVYNAYASNEQPLPEPADKIDYFDYCHWINAMISDGLLDQNKLYWEQKYVDDIPDIVDLPLDRERPALQSFNGNTIYYKIEAELENRIHRYCTENMITENIFFVSLLFLLYYKLSGSEDLVIGTPMINRDVIELESLYGSFACGIPLRCKINNLLSIQDLFMNMRNEVAMNYDNHTYPFNYILEEMKFANDSSRSKLFSIMFGMQNDKLTLKNEQLFDKLELEFIDSDFVENTARFDLTFSIETINGLMLKINYNTDLFMKKTMETFIERYMKIVFDTLENDKKTVGEFSVILDYDRKVFHEGCVGPCVELGTDTFVSRFHENVKRNSNATAIIEGEQVKTYRDIYETSQILTDVLVRKYLVCQGDRVGIKMEQNADYIIAVLAVLQAGATFVPMGNEYPINRINDIVEQAAIKVIVTEDEEKPGDVKWLNFTKEMQSIEFKNTEYNNASLDKVAYIIFTSGSTGKPKGIEVEHRGIMNLFNWTSSKYPLYENDATLFMTSLTFDVSILEYLYPLMCGACVKIIENEHRGNPQYIGKLAEDDVVILQFVPDLMNAFIDSFRNGEFESPKRLKYVICAGGVLTKRLIDEFRELFECQLSNHYGPTEATVDTIFHEIEGTYERGNVPIGRAIDNTTVYVLDKYNKQVPVGVRGELCINSLSLARGYAGQPELTNRAFIYWLDEKGKEVRIYKTGDIGYVNHDANICFVGRKDNQVKIRGNRIELEDIENTAKKIQQVRTSAVILNNNQLELVVDLNNRNSISVKDGSAYLYSLEQMPYKMRELEDINVEVWPEYFKYNEATSKFWPSLFTDYLDYQIVLLNDMEEIVGIGHTLPIKWDGTKDGLPKGWDGGIQSGVDFKRKGADTLLVLAGIVPSGQQGKGYSKTIIKAFKLLAAIHGLNRILVPVRPTRKYCYPLIDMTEYLKLKDENGQVFDPWVRTHLNMGGTILACEEESQRVAAPIEEWETWMQKEIRNDIETYDKCLSAIRFDHVQGLGVYYDPCVWIEHEVGITEEYSQLITGGEIRKFLSDMLPGYMIPDRIEIMHQLPRLTNEKIDKNKIKSWLSFSNKTRGTVEEPATVLEQELTELWGGLLNCEVGVLDDFYKLGGHSLLATVLINRINNKYNVNMPLKTFVSNPTVKSVASYIEDLIQTKRTERSDILEIKPVQEIENDCFEDQMFSVLQWLGYECRYLYANSWNFYWEDEENGELTEKLGTGADASTMMQTMKGIYGIDYKTREFSSFYDTISSIEEYLDEKKPVVIMDDSYYCHWAPNYYQYHDNHCCIITGIDMDKEVLYITDGFYSMNGIEYAFEDIEKGFQGVCLYIEDTFRKTEVNIDNIRGYFIENMKEREHFFEDMVKFSDSLIRFDWKELKNNDDVKLCDVYKIFYQLKLKRMQLKQLLIVLEYEKDLLDLNDEVNDLWERIVNLVIKLLFRPENARLSEKLQNRIRQVSLVEQRLYKELMEVSV